MEIVVIEAIEHFFEETKYDQFVRFRGINPP